MTEQLKQAEALRLADWLQRCAESIEHVNAAAELRRLHALTAAQPAQAGEVDEWEAFKAWNRSTFAVTPLQGWNARAAYQARLASLPTQPAAQATPEPREDEARRLIDTLRNDARGGLAATVHELDAAANLIEALLSATPTQQAAGEPVWEAVYQLQSGDGKWIDQARASYDYNVKHGNAVRVLYHRHAPVETEPVVGQATVPRDAYDALERERDYWRTRARAMIDHAEGTCWYWMGDGSDHPESMVNSLPVVIRADQLRELLARPAPGVPEGAHCGIESAAKFIEQKAHSYAEAFGYDDAGSLSFGTGQHAEIKLDHYNSLIELADEVRALAAAQAKGGEHV